MMTELAVDSLGPFTAACALAALTEACRIVGIPSADAELIRLGSNAVFRLDADTIARVAPSLDKRESAARQVAVSRWLASVSYPATRVWPVDQPVSVEGRVVTFWESVAPGTVYAPIGRVAELIRRLHELPAPPEVELPELRPFGAPDDPVPSFEGLVLQP